MEEIDKYLLLFYYLLFFWSWLLLAHLKDPVPVGERLDRIFRGFTFGIILFLFKFDIGKRLTRVLKSKNDYEYAKLEIEMNHPLILRFFKYTDIYSELKITYIDQRFEYITLINILCHGIHGDLDHPVTKMLYIDNNIKFKSISYVMILYIIRYLKASYSIKKIRFVETIYEKFIVDKLSKLCEEIDRWF